ncbi:MAG: hypothetical protein RI885_1186 [Actinomycetota bacterium]
MTDPAGTPKQDGVGDDSTIPASDDGLAVTLGGTDSHFNEEEDEAVSDDVVDDGDDTADSSGVAHGDD